MTIPVTGTGGLFTRLGKFIGGSNEAQTGVNATLTARIAAIQAQYLTTDQSVVNNTSTLLQVQTQYQNSVISYLTSISSFMKNTLISMALDVYPNMNPVTFSQALTLLINEMNSGGYATESIQRSTISQSVTLSRPSSTSNTPIGNGVMCVGLTDWDGRPLDYVMAETLLATCTADGYPSGGAVAGSEPFRVLGQPASNSIYSSNYPQGSGANISISTLDTTKASGLIVTDGDFANWTTPTVPTSWTVAVGSVLRNATAFTGSYAMEFLGDAATLTSITQPLTSVTLAPNRVYCCNLWLKQTGIAAGVLRIRLTDGAGAAVNDDTGTAIAHSITLSGVTGSYTNFNFFFSTPAVLPTTVPTLKLELALTTAITNAGVLLIDDVGIVAATQLYTGGPYAAIFTGNVDFAIGDTFTIAIANNACTSSSDYFGFQLNRFWGLSSLGVKIPSANSPTISNSLISP